MKKLLQRFALPSLLAASLCFFTIPSTALAQHRGGGGGGFHGGGGGGFRGGGGFSGGGAVRGGGSFGGAYRGAPAPRSRGSYAGPSGGAYARPNSSGFRPYTGPGARSAGAARMAGGATNAPRAQADGQWHSFGAPRGNVASAAPAGNAGAGRRSFSSNGVSNGVVASGATGGVTRSWSGQGNQIMETTPRASSGALSMTNSRFGSSGFNSANFGNWRFGANSGTNFGSNFGSGRLGLSSSILPSNRFGL